MRFTYASIMTYNTNTKRYTCAACDSSRPPSALPNLRPQARNVHTKTEVYNQSTLDLGLHPLPNDPREEALGVLADKILADFVEEKDTEREGKGEEYAFDRNTLN